MQDIAHADGQGVEEYQHRSANQQFKLIDRPGANQCGCAKKQHTGQPVAVWSRGLAGPNKIDDQSEDSKTHDDDDGGNGYHPG